MTITRVSTASTYARTIDNYTSLQVKEANFSKQLSSGVKADSFVDIGKGLREVINIESSVRSLEGYVSSNDAVISRLQAMDSAIEQMYDVMAGLKQDIIIEQSNPENLQLDELAQTALNQAASNLDVRQGSRYLFSGSKITVPPSGNVNVVPNVDASTFEKNLAYYQGDSLQVATQASDALDVTYGITGDHQAFQDIFAAAHLAIEADSLTASTKQRVLAESQNLIDSGLDGLLSLRAQIGSDIRSLENFNSQHEKVQIELEIRYSDLLATDVAAVTIEQSLNQTVIQATLQNFATITSLNLADFL